MQKAWGSASDVIENVEVVEDVLRPHIIPTTSPETQKKEAMAAATAVLAWHIVASQPMSGE